MIAEASPQCPENTKWKGKLPALLELDSGKIGIELPSEL
jgi:hypothetical protein